MEEWKKCNWRNLQGIQGENEKLSVILLPELGGKLASLYYKPLKIELAAQNRRDRYDLPSLDADFSRYDASGLDDAFPNINANKINDMGNVMIYPDHGEIWSSRFSYAIRKDGIHLSYHSKRFPYLYQKEASLGEDAVTLHYRITNTEQKPFPCIWTFHGLFRYEEDMVLVFPESVKQFINVLEDLNADEQRGYPSVVVPPANSNAMMKYYAKGRVDTGTCGFYYPKHKLKCILNYDPVKLPYLGIWITAGGYRGDYNCALEPSNGFYDDIEIAGKNGCLYYLEPNQPLEFTLKIQVNEDPLLPYHT